MGYWKQEHEVWSLLHLYLPPLLGVIRSIEAIEQWCVGSDIRATASYNNWISIAHRQLFSFALSNFLCAKGYRSIQTPNHPPPSRPTFRSFTHSKNLHAYVRFSVIAYNWRHGHFLNQRILKIIASHLIGWRRDVMLDGVSVNCQQNFSFCIWRRRRRFDTILAFTVKYGQNNDGDDEEHEEEDDKCWNGQWDWMMTEDMIPLTKHAGAVIVLGHWEIWDRVRNVHVIIEKLNVCVVRLEIHFRDKEPIGVLAKIHPDLYHFGNTMVNWNFDPTRSFGLSVFFICEMDDLVGEIFPVYWEEYRSRWKGLKSCYDSRANNFFVYLRILTDFIGSMD